MSVWSKSVRGATWLLAALAALALFALAGAADAQIYVYKDQFGRTYFTDTPPHDGYAAYRPKNAVQRVSAAPKADSAQVAKSYDLAIRRASRQHGVSAALVKAVIAAESGFDPLAESRRGARGLMQLMPATADQLGVDDAYDPWQNIDGGTRYLCEMIDRFPGELELALAAYNAGPETVRQFQGVPPYAETRGYVKRVLRLYEKYHADFR
ncbi:MAG TPA: lytic transglycosylase domain-containing protein [Myxococcota bacterium]|nr:lytic transglycosylase domain-containing protein [Myxococcota bacterium]